MIVSHGEVVLHLQQCECPDEQHTGKAFFRIEVDRPVDLYEQWQGKGLEFRFELGHQDWGQSDFQVVDPDGNILLFAGPTPGE